MDTLLLSKTDIEKVITMKDVVEIVDKTFIGFGEGKVINPTKVNIDFGSTVKWPHYNSNMNAMPAYVGWLDSAGINGLAVFQIM